MKRSKWIIWVGVIVMLLIVSMLVAVTVGRYRIPLRDIVKAFSGQVIEDRYTRTVLFNIRIPRMLLALIAGAGLSVAGAAFQSMFSNPLATPDTLGVATGASFGATLAILFRFPSIGIQLMAFVMGAVAVGIVYLISRVKGESSIIMLILSGMVISALFDAMVSLLKYVADPEEVLPEITYWLMGSLSGTGYDDLMLGSPALIVGTLMLFLLRWKMNVLSLHEDEARALGVNLKLVRTLTITASTMITAATIAMCGKVGWVGLLVPHVSRMIFGNNNKYVIPASIGLGASFLLVIDTLARSLTAAEIPISILTAVIGAPFFIILLRRTGGIKT